MMTTTLALAILAQLTISDPRQAEVEGLLDTRRLTVDFSGGETLEGALQAIKDQLRIDIHLSPKVRDKHGAPDVTLRLTQCTARTVLKILLSDKGLTMVWRKGVLVVVDREDFVAQTVTRVYDVRDLLNPLRHFAGPKVALASGDDGGGTALTGAIFDPAADETTEVITEDFLVDIVKQMTPQGKWDESADRVSISLAGKLLVVRQTEAVQAEIGKLVNLLRQYK